MSNGDLGLVDTIRYKLTVHSTLTSTDKLLVLQCDAAGHPGGRIRGFQDPGDTEDVHCSTAGQSQAQTAGGGQVNEINKIICLVLIFQRFQGWQAWQRRLHPAKIGDHCSFDEIGGGIVRKWENFFREQFWEFIETVCSSRAEHRHQGWAYQEDLKPK